MAVTLVHFVLGSCCNVLGRDMLHFVTVYSSALHEQPRSCLIVA